MSNSTKSLKKANIRWLKFHQVAREKICPHEDLSLPEVILGILLLCLRMTSEHFQSARACGQFKQVFCSSPHLSAQRSNKFGYDIYSVEVSPSPASTIPTPSAFTDEQKAFIGLHHKKTLIF